MPAVAGAGIAVVGTGLYLWLAAVRPDVGWGLGADAYRGPSLLGLGLGEARMRGATVADIVSEIR